MCASVEEIFEDIPRVLTSDASGMWRHLRCSRCKAFFVNIQADRAYGTEISPRSFVVSFVILLYAISYNICI